LLVVLSGEISTPMAGYDGNDPTQRPRALSIAMVARGLATVLWPRRRLEAGRQRGSGSRDR
jgi:hypothetical protein